jgi:hypothetical protein
MDSPEVQFFRVVKIGRDPEPAPRDAGGNLPSRAVRYCDAVTVASAYGWWLYPPVDCFVRWDGIDIWWSTDGSEWGTISDTVAWPIEDEDFYAGAPTEVAAVPPPPFLTALPEPGHLQVSLGVAAKAPEGWGLHVRMPANAPMSGGFEFFEGIIDPAVWFGPLFINLRIMSTGKPMRLYGDRPLAQVQAVPWEALRARSTVHDMGPDEWALWEQSIGVPAADRFRRFGAYGVRARKGRKIGVCPVHHREAEA